MLIISSASVEQNQKKHLTIPCVRVSNVIPKEKEDKHMILNTHPGYRKEMVRAISERIALPARYMGMPLCA